MPGRDRQGGSLTELRGRPPALVQSSRFEGHLPFAAARHAGKLRSSYVRAFFSVASCLHSNVREPSNDLVREPLHPFAGGSIPFPLP